ncbi:MAG: ferric reductase-like transmembrane domain-containing protein [Solirubrobacteraceae bacterium]
MIGAAIASPSAFWFLTRGTGAVTLALLTLSVALGVSNVRRTRFEQVPRFVFDALHRSASLLAVSFLLVHILTSLLDGFAPIRLLDVVLPFGSAYRPVWLGLGAVAFDLLIAVTVTSLMRRRLGYGAWRVTHWLAYACWPVALVHGLGTGSDTKTHWMLLLVASCMAVMIAAVLARASAGWPGHRGVRVGAFAASAVLPLGLLAWLPSGPLARGWSQRAGTPSTLLPKAITTAAASRPHTSFSAVVTGTVHRARVDGGLSEIHLSLSVAGQRFSTLGARIYGHRVEDGELQLTSSRVELGTSSDPRLYFGRVTRLAGTELVAVVANPSGSPLVLDARMRLNPESDQARGTVTVRPAGA